MLSSILKPILGGILPATWDCEVTPSCSEWLAGQTNIEPDHLCWQCAAKSVREFLTHWGLLTEHSPHYLTTWPLPVGQNALNKWAFLRAPLEIGEDIGFLQFHDTTPNIEPPFCINITIDGPSLHPLLSTISADPDAWLIAVAYRQLDAGKVWMLGTVASIGAKWRAPLSGHLTYGWSGKIERINETCDDGEKQHFVEYEWGAGFPYMVTVSAGGGDDEAQAFLKDGRRLTLAPLQSLHETSRKLAAWWSKMQLKMTAGGRPVGSKERWLDKDDFVSAVCTAINAITQQKHNPTQEKVVEYLSDQRTHVTRPHADSHLYSVRQLRRDYQDFGFANWTDLKNACFDG